MSVKLEEGDFRGAVRLASSDDTLAPMSEETYQALLERHPSPHANSVIPPMDEEWNSKRERSFRESDPLQGVRPGDLMGLDHSI